MIGLAIWIIAACIVIPVLIWIGLMIFAAGVYIISAPFWLLNWFLTKLGISTKKMARSLRMKHFAGDFSNKKIAAEWLKGKVHLYDKFLSANTSSEARINEVAGQFDDMLGLSKNLCKLASEIGERLNGREDLFISGSNSLKDEYHKRGLPIPTWRFKTVPLNTVIKRKMWSPNIVSIKIGNLIFNSNVQWVSEHSSDGAWSLGIYNEEILVFQATTQKHFEQVGEGQMSIRETVKNIKRTSLPLFKPGMWILSLHNLLIDFKEELPEVLDDEKSEIRDKARENQINRFTPV